MATPLTNIEQGITNGNWELVCDGFNKLTGKKLKPPIIPEVVVNKTMDLNTASKRDLYNFIKSKYDIAPIKTYTIEELRELASVYSMNENYEDKIEELSPSEPKPLKEGVFLDGFRYHSGKKQLLPMDKIKVNAVLDPMLKDVKDPTNEYTPREPPKKAMMKCLKCSKKFSNWSYLGIETDGELKALCPICSEII